MLRGFDRFKGEVFGEPRIHHQATVHLLKGGAEVETEVAFVDSPGRGKASFQRFRL